MRSGRPGRARRGEALSDEREHGDADDEQDRRLAARQLLEDHVVNGDNEGVTTWCRLRTESVPSFHNLGRAADLVGRIGAFAASAELEGEQARRGVAASAIVALGSEYALVVNRRGDRPGPPIAVRITSDVESRPA